MTNQTWITVPLACATVLSIGLLAQDNPPPVKTNADISGLPAGRGIYYHAASEWVALPLTVLMPLWEGRSAVAEVLNVGADHAVVGMAGSHSGVQIGNDPRPTFYLHGIEPAELKLVRTVPKVDYREVQMPISRHFWDWAHFRSKDLADIDVQPLGGDVISVRPRTALKPGEYTLASAAEPGGRWVMIGFDFGLVGGQAAQ